jgi:hypothetical protein
MVTKMKMFGFMHGFMQNGSANNSANTANAVAAKAKQSSSNFNMKNLASIMNAKSTGCKSCRG